MPQITVTIEWDKPNEPFWLNPDNVCLALNAYCANTHFIVRNAEITKERGDQLGLARNLRYAVIQQQYDLGNLTEYEAIELLRGSLSPGDPSTIFDDSSRLIPKSESVR